MMPEQFFSVLVSAITLGSLYCLMSMGLTVIFSTLNVFNFAHGSFLTLGAYLAWFAISTLGLGHLGAFLLMIVINGLIGAAMQMGLLSRLLKEKQEDAVIILTLGVGSLIENGCMLIFGPRYKRFPPVFEGFLKAGFLTVTYQELLILIVALGILVTLIFFLEKTKTGMAMRAVQQDTETASMLGIKVDRIYTYTMIICSLLAGIAGVFLGSIFFIEPGMGNEPLTKSFIVCVLGGLGSLKGTIVASFVIALIETMTALFLGLYWTMAVMFIVMMIMVIVRPYGLLGEKI